MIYLTQNDMKNEITQINQLATFQNSLFSFLRILQIIFCTRQRDAIYSREVVSFWWSSVTKAIFENVTV